VIAFLILKSQRSLSALEATGNKTTTLEKSPFYLLGGRSTPTGSRVEHRVVIGEARNAQSPPSPAAHLGASDWSKVGNPE